MTSISALFQTVILPPALAAQINVNIPGTESVATGGPGAAVANFYQFALMIGGLLAFAMIVYGGLKYTFAAGNPERQRDAKDQVVQALLGLALLLGSYLILNLINPRLTNLTIDLGALQKAVKEARDAQLQQVQRQNTALNRGTYVARAQGACREGCTNVCGTDKDCFGGCVGPCAKAGRDAMAAGEKGQSVEALKGPMSHACRAGCDSTCKSKCEGSADSSCKTECNDKCMTPCANVNSAWRTPTPTPAPQSNPVEYQYGQ